MNKHDYTQNTVASISDAITNSKNEVNNAVLSIESMTYSWDTEIIQNVVTWLEVQTILELKQEIGRQFEKENSKFEQIQIRIKQTDETASSKLEKTKQGAGKCKLIAETLLKNLGNIVPELKV